MITKLPVAHRLEDPTQFDVQWQEYTERKAKLYCVQGHDFVEMGPVFFCGKYPDVHFFKECSRCHTREDAA